MKQSIYGIAFILTTFTAFSAYMIHHPGHVSAKPTESVSRFHEELSGDWDAVAEAMGTKTALTLSLKVDGDKLTGSINSGHTGSGTISGTVKDSKFEFTATFAKHESIVFKGELMHDKITGEYATEGRVSQWEASKRTAAAKTQSAASDNKSNDLSGTWEALLTAGDTSAPLTLTFANADGKLTGTGHSDHLGDGKLENLTWKDNKVSFLLRSLIANIQFEGTIKDGKLEGHFDAGQMSGIWSAKRP